jgi:hypothetical protein
MSIACPLIGTVYFLQTIFTTDTFDATIPATNLIDAAIIATNHIGAAFQPAFHRAK